MSEVSREALTRVEFSDIGTPKPLQKRWVGRKGGVLAVEDRGLEVKEIMHAANSIGREVRKTIGDAGTALVVSGVKAAGVVVLQAAS